MNIGELQRVTDLAEDEHAEPERGTQYGLRSIDNTIVETDVEFVVRRDQRLFARGTCGNEFPVSGPNAFVLVPRSRSNAVSRGKSNAGRGIHTGR
jgi:hypothetical protein